MSSDRTLELIRNMISMALLITAVILTVQMIGMARKVQDMKMDLAEINHVRHGLLNADAWRDQVTLILGKKIVEFDLTPENRGELQDALERIMYELLDDLEEIIDERTSGQFAGMKKWIAGMVLNVDQLRDSVPSYAGQVLDEINRPATKLGIQNYLNDKLGDLSDATYSLDSTRVVDQILQKYGLTGKTEGRETLSAGISSGEEEINLRVMLILIVVLLIFLLNAIARTPPDRFRAPVLVLASFSLLAGGISTPMIDLEARIDMLQFSLIGELVVFRDNIIFFQTKSITDIVEILIRDGSFEMIFVGILIFTFSIVFPITKLVSSWLYSLRLGELNNNRLIRFFVIKSGKWSMADVMVVAIFMAYIGFNGIVGNQLDMLRESSESVEIFTTNGTRLLGGFYLFLSFCISSLVLSEILVRKTNNIST
jgi:hypothetical protein